MILSLSGTSQRYNPLSVELTPLGLFSCMLWLSPQLWYRREEFGEEFRGSLPSDGGNQLPEILVSQQKGCVVTQSNLVTLESPRLSRDITLLLGMSSPSCTNTTSTRYMTISKRAFYA